MNQEQKLEEYLLAIKGLDPWEQKKDVLENLLDAIQEKEQKDTTRWLAAASFTVLILSGFILLAGIKKKQEVELTQIEQISKIYAVNNLNY